jgi:hypothetical protein
MSGSLNMPSAAVQLDQLKHDPAPACGLNGGLSRAERAHPCVGRFAGVLIAVTLGISHGIKLRVHQVRLPAKLSSQGRSNICHQIRSR